MPEDVDLRLAERIKKLREEGQEVHAPLLCILARATCVELKQEALLSCNGGKLSFSNEWARCWLKQHGYVVRQATQAKEKKVMHA